jgi:hypothetical protein
MLHLADIALYVIHLSIIVYSLIGWAWPRGRRAHLIFLGVIFACWFGIGLALGYGFGYCPLTDWHWQLKTQLGASYAALPNSFIKHVWDGALLWPISARAADILTFVAFFASVAITIYLNFIKRTPPNEPTAADPAPAAD